MAALITVTGIRILRPHSKGPDWWSLLTEGKKKRKEKKRQRTVLHATSSAFAHHQVCKVCFIHQPPHESLVLMTLFHSS